MRGISTIGMYTVLAIVPLTIIDMHVVLVYDVIHLLLLNPTLLQDNALVYFIISNLSVIVRPCGAHTQRDTESARGESKEIWRELTI